MKLIDNQYKFSKLNAKFDRDLDRLKDKYNREAAMLMYGDAQGLDMTTRRNRLWMWFDRKTKYQLLPKILILVLVLCIGVDAILMAAMMQWEVDFIGSIDLGVVALLLHLTIPGMAVCLAGVFANINGRSVNNLQDNLFNKYPTVTDPAWQDLKENVWHREEGL
ncbi:MAG: hypothetical protein KA801_00715 [Syntrophorhabdaceae bacterium]|nr:hypothetical protein [Syntrophorhabdaceae bacterium]